MVRKYSVILILFVVSCVAVIAKDKDKPLPSGDLPGMQEFTLSDSKEEPGELIFSPEELSEILKHTQGAEFKEDSLDQPQEETIGVMPVEPVEEDPDQVAEEVLERILKGIEDKPIKKTPSKQVQEPPPVQKPFVLSEEVTIEPEKPKKKVTEKMVKQEPEKEEIEEEVKKIIPIVTKSPVQVKKPEEPPKPKPKAKPKRITRKKPAEKKVVADMETYFQQGVQFYAQRELRKGAQSFERALDENEEDRETYYMLADIYYQLYDMEKAWKNIQMAVSLNGNRVNPLYKAIQGEVGGQYPVPSNIFVTFMASAGMIFCGTILFFLYKRKGADTVAREEIKQLKKEIGILKMKNDIQDPRVRYYKALEACENGSTMLALNNLMSAEEEFRTAIILYPQVLHAYLGLGYIHFMQKKYDTAIRDYAEALDVDPNSSTAYYGIGRSYGEKGDNRTQMEKVQMAVQLDPNFHEAVETLQFLKVRHN